MNKKELESKIDKLIEIESLLLDLLLGFLIFVIIFGIGFTFGFYANI